MLKIKKEIGITEPGKGRQVFAVGLVGFCAFLSLYSTQPLLPLFHRIFHASKLAVSLTVSSATLAVALAAPFVGIIADMRGRKKVIVPAIYLLACSNFLIASSPGLSAIIFWRFIQGLLTPAVFAVAYINEEWDARESDCCISQVGKGGFEKLQDIICAMCIAGPKPEVGDQPCLCNKSQ
ncbi:MAG: MFS transporter [Desulfuromonadales bacterium]|nr:MFS transporter [Desulfuromonadales bacterium]